ncbi:hypothetical protein OSB04_016730 [Centaurea solstitialis]|uniref:Uncharacterized protein n=1 Tax=Centaurea solstitialis TaxID=347529 RepID=A0AA38TDF0_9ASTR|nr:hypothetical protein OSB04_016730 [Centaurea solstitialis]
MREMWRNRLDERNVGVLAGLLDWFVEEFLFCSCKSIRFWPRYEFRDCARYCAIWHNSIALVPVIVPAIFPYDTIAWHYRTIGFALVNLCDCDSDCDTVTIACHYSIRGADLKFRFSAFSSHFHPKLHLSSSLFFGGDFRAMNALLPCDFKGFVQDASGLWKGAVAGQPFGSAIGMPPDCCRNAEGSYFSATYWSIQSLLVTPVFTFCNLLENPPPHPSDDEEEYSDEEELYQEQDIIQLANSKDGGIMDYAIPVLG